MGRGAIREPRCLANLLRVVKRAFVVVPGLCPARRKVGGGANSALRLVLPFIGFLSLRERLGEGMKIQDAQRHQIKVGA